MAIDVRPDQYALGKGRFYFAEYLPSGALDAYRFIGNVPTYTLTPSSDTLTHTSSLGGINVQDRDIIISQTLAIAFSTDNMSLENKALWMGATVDPITVTAATAQTLTVASPKLGYVYPLGVTTVNPAGAKDVTVTTVVQGATTLVNGTDYSVNGRAGLVTFLPTGAAVAGTPVTITYNVAASTRSQVNARNRVITGAVKFISDNPDTGIGKVDDEHFLPFVRLAADGDWSLIGDDWQSFGFTGSVLQRYDTVGNPIPQHTITPLTVPAA